MTIIRGCRSADNDDKLHRLILHTIKRYMWDLWRNTLAMTTTGVKEVHARSSLFSRLNGFLLLFQMAMELHKRLDEVRLLESRKSARLADQDTDFARLADMAGDRRKSGNNLEMPLNFK